MLALGLHYQVDVLESLTLVGCILSYQYPSQPRPYSGSGYGSPMRLASYTAAGHPGDQRPIVSHMRGQR